jgi:hypothetical protein
LSHITDMRNLLLAARKDVEAAQAIMDANPTPEDIEDLVNQAHHRLMIAESRCAILAEE